MEVKTIGVVGAGQMGAGIAQVAAQAGFSVIMSDISLELAQRGLGGVQKFLTKSVEKGKMSEDDKNAVLKRIKPTANMTEFKECEFIIEAATENIELKKRIFKELDAIAKPEAIIATNTSSISITLLAAQTKRPQKVVGMHFMNPVPLMKLVELIRGLPTDDEAFAVTKRLSEKMGKTTTVSKDYPGFIVNRILMPMINEAFYSLMEGVGEPKDIDDGLILGCNHPMGPLALADLIGLDTCLAIMTVLHNGLGDSKYRPCPLLVKYVEAGWLGRKTGRGVYSY
ncbi:MAG: 3-hydroxybutyryl-CoA dehydrogenase [Myxococcota bacterium]